MFDQEGDTELDEYWSTHDDLLPRFSKDRDQIVGRAKG